MFDTHAHLEMIDSKVSDIIERAKAASVTRILTAGTTESANSFVLEQSQQFEGIVYGAVAYDRDQTNNDLPQMVASIDKILSSAPAGIVAVGETGLDFHYLRETADAQTALFEAQLDLAAKHTLPVIVHSREAENETIACLKSHAAKWSGEPDRIGVIHCFTASQAFAKEALALGFMISFSGILTFKKARELREIAKSLPMERLLVETDAPYLAPEPLRGKKNEPAYLPHTVACLAELRGMSTGEMASVTEANACRLFGIAS
jgi:TatD DNase family protein